MVEKNVVRQDIVELLFKGSGFEDIFHGEDALNQFTESARGAGSALDDTGQSMMELFAQSELLGKIADTGKKVLAALMECVDAAAAFETSLAKLETIADTSAVSMENLSDDLLALSNNTGVAVTSLTESAYQAISASVDTASAVEFVAQANELAVGGFTSTETAVDVLSTAINAYGLEVSQAGQLSDYLITTQNLGKTSVDELAQSVGKVIPLASAYNVEMDNLSAAYAVLTANGIATAETGTYLKSMFNELADSGSAVASVLQEETGKSFSQLSASGESLGDILAIIGASVEGDATAFSNLWSSSEAGVGALSLLNAGTARYNSVLHEMQNSTGAASKAYETMTDTAAHAQEELVNAANNLKIAVGNGLLDTFSELNSKGAEALKWLTEFVQEHEALVSGLTVGVAVAALLTVGLVGMSVAVTTLTASAAALNVTTGGLLLVVGSLIAGAAALTGVLVGLSGAFSDEEEEVADYNGTLKECRSEIELTEASLDKARRRYGENSDAVKKLESDLETLNKQYEKGGGYCEELREQAQAAADAIGALNESVQTQYTEIDTMQTSGMQAVSMLEALSERADKTDADLSLMQSYADYLNDTFHCNIVVDYDTGSLTGFNPENIVQGIFDDARQAEIEAASAALSDPDFLNSYTAAYEQMTLAQSNYQNVMKELLSHDNGLELSMMIREALQDGIRPEDINEASLRISDAYLTDNALPEDYLARFHDAAVAAVETEEAFISVDATAQGLCGTMDDTGAVYETLTGALQGNTAAAEEALDAMTAEEQGISDACSTVESYKDEILALCQAYDDAYAAAYDSFSGQFSLFDQAQADADATVAAAQTALDSQLSFWQNYNANLEVLAGTSAESLGITQENYDALMAYAQDGSEQAAGLAASMAQAIASGNEEAIVNLAETIGEIDAAQQTAADTTAQWQTGLNEAMQNTIHDMSDSLRELDMGTEAYSYADSTMSGYIDGILNSVSSARSAAQSVVSAVQSVFSSASLTYSASGAAGSVSLQANASGTTNAAEAFIAGEEGAELILDKGGSTVFPASETAKIIRAVEDYTDFSGGYIPGHTAAMQSSTISYAPQFYLSLNGGMSDTNLGKVKRWAQQAVNEAFESVLRVNPSVYVI